MNTYQTAAYVADYRRQLMRDAEMSRQVRAGWQSGTRRRSRRRIAAVLRLAAR